MTYNPITGEGEEESAAEPCLCGHRQDNHQGPCMSGWDTVSEIAPDGWGVTFRVHPTREACRCPEFRRPVTEHPMSDCPWEAA